MESQKFWGQRISGPKIFGRKKKIGPKNFLVQKSFVLKNCWVQKVCFKQNNLCTNNLPKKINVLSEVSEQNLLRVWTTISPIRQWRPVSAQAMAVSYHHKYHKTSLQQESPSGTHSAAPSWRRTWQGQTALQRKTFTTSLMIS